MITIGTNRLNFSNTNSMTIYSICGPLICINVYLDLHSQKDVRCTNIQTPHTPMCIPAKFTRWNEWNQLKQLVLVSPFHSDFFPVSLSLSNWQLQPVIRFESFALILSRKKVFHVVHKNVFSRRINKEEKNWLQMFNTDFKRSILCDFFVTVCKAIEGLSFMCISGGISRWIWGGRPENHFLVLKNRIEEDFSHSGVLQILLIPPLIYMETYFWLENWLGEILRWKSE